MLAASAPFRGFPFHPKQLLPMATDVDNICRLSNEDEDESGVWDRKQNDHGQPLRLV